jgi:hypothetical protein
MYHGAQYRVANHEAALSVLLQRMSWFAATKPTSPHACADVSGNLIFAPDLSGYDPFSTIWMIGFAVMHNPPFPIGSNRRR